MPDTPARKLYWTLEGKLPGGDYKFGFVAVRDRPSMTIEEKNNSGILNPLDFKWNKFTVYAVDANESNLAFWNVIVPSVCDFATTDGPELGYFKINLMDEKGKVIEEWELHDAYISDFHYSDWYGEKEKAEMEISYNRCSFKKL